MLKLFRRLSLIFVLFYISLKFGNGLEYLTHFMKVPKCDLKDAKTLMTLDVDASSCSKNCFETSACKSFVSRTISPSCILYEDDSTEKMLIDVLHTDFYQLRRSVPTEYRDGRCPLEFIYNAALFLNNDLGNYFVSNYTQCLFDCEVNSNCKTAEYNFRERRCVLSSKDHTTVKLYFSKDYSYTNINRELWNDFKQSNTLEKINSVGCGIRVYDSYNFVNKKEISDSIAYSTFSFKQNPYHNLITEAQMNAHSVLDCSRLCMISSTCTAFSYTNTKCVLKKLDDI